MLAAERRPLRVTALFTRMGELFLAGQLRELVSFWNYPCPVEMDGELVVMPRPELLEMFFATRLAAARAAGMTAMIPRIIAVELPRNSRFRVWLRWSYRFEGREEEDPRASVFYMARRPWGELAIEMMDVVPDRPAED